jgi:glycosyltransferase involved in cell wall biosynthesis
MTFFDRECGPIRRAIVRAAFRNADLVLVLGPQWRHDVLRICSAAKIEILPNGVPLPSPSDIQLTGSDLEPRIATLGRLGHRKGTFDLLRAFSRVAKRHPSARLVCIGDGEIQESRTLAEELGIEATVEFPGWLAADEAREQLCRATIFALPSYAEGLPMALLEAMSYGLPVVTTPVGGIPAVVSHGETGLLVGPGDVEGLASAISELLGNSDARARLGQAARVLVSTEYSLDAVLRRIRRIYARYGVDTGAPDGNEPACPDRALSKSTRKSVTPSDARNYLSRHLA